MAVGARCTATNAAVKSANNPLPTPATIAAPTAVASSVSTRRTGRPSTLALIVAHRSSRAPPPTMRISPRPRPSASSRSTMSRNAYAQPSSTARATCAGVWFIARPRKAPRIESFQRGAVDPDSAGRNSTPSLAGGAAAASGKTSACETPSSPASHSVLPPLTNPGFSISHEPGTAWPWVSTTPSGSRTGVAAAVVTGSAVPVTSTTTPDSIAPAPTDAACSSPVPTTTAQLVGRPNSAATPGRRVPTTSVDGRTGGSIAGSRPAAAHSSASKSPRVTSYTIVDDAFAASWA